MIMIVIHYLRQFEYQLLKKKKNTEKWRGMDVNHLIFIYIFLTA